ncbi:MAG: hypothetical protein IPQ07_32480 [Myxococcales bacterium]|nr:hypothetical protein [Myxococcales bacterium]
MIETRLVRLLLGEPERVLTHLERMRTRGIVDVAPNPWQLCLGVLRLWHRTLFRTETVGTSSNAIRATWRARLLANRAVRLPFLLAERAVAPFDFTGLRSPPERLIRHLLGAHHDGNQFVFDLEILTGHGELERLQRRVAELLAQPDSPRTRWLRDLTVFEGYHEQLAAAVERALAAGPAMTTTEANDPDLSFRAYLRWCARQPATLVATVGAWRTGQFAFDSGLAS